MKSIINIIFKVLVCLILWSSLSGCKDEKPSTSETVNDYLASSSAVAKDTLDNSTNNVSKYANLLDTLKQYNSKLLYISNENKVLNDEVRGLKNTVKKIENLKLMFWIALLIGIFVLLLFLIIIIQSRQNKKLIKDFQYKYKNIKLDYDKNKNLNPKFFEDINNELKKLNNRIENIEKQSSKLTPKNSSGKKSDRSNPQIKKTGNGTIPAKVSQKKTGYFGSPTNSEEPYFNELMEQWNEDARFSVEVDENNKATFKPIENNKYLNTILSSDTLRSVITFADDIPQNATHMKVEQEGDAELIEGRWYIKSNPIVKLS